MTPRSIDGVSNFFGLRWESANVVRMPVRPDLINAAGLLSGAATYALVDYCMGSTLWRETTEDEGIATVSISINYVATATEGEVVCETTLDRRNRRLAVLRSEVRIGAHPAEPGASARDRADNDHLIATAIGSYTIFPRRKLTP
ncbi:MAG TPA: PaaI family thioesterase [Thermoleophilaceae bacterium]|nr:PaaI family thioesterase [Thermoleophilaceae bacterium]